ncbi:hypothetical protein GFL85_13755 [Rhizobium laguerreae]|uniref:hypothetical protein n=1 Tax=Rhizobium laguerreae TaxID=1076926 RepID=UPI00143F0B85|nr:hypothetical protein [Rhizobium laguerreae]NKM12084.1 hypothetical protein [Rhizobium laguerreae]
MSSELGEPIAFDQVARLRLFYQSIGVEFLGTADFATNLVSGAGVRFGPPRGAGGPPNRDPMWVPFAAARALLGHELSRVADESGLSTSVISRIEGGDGYGSRSALILLQHYRASGIEFLRAETAVDTHLFVGARLLPRR